MVDSYGSDIAVENNIARIAEQLLQGRMGFLFGSGMSIPSGSINGKELGYQLVKRGLFPAADATFEGKLRLAGSKYPLEAIAAGVVPSQTFQETGLIDILKEVTFPNGRPTIHDGHIKLASMIEKLRTVRILFTTNWDSLLKDAIGESAIEITPKNQNEYMFKIDEFKAMKILIVHLHGTFRDEPYICEKDLMDVDKPLFQLFLSEMMTKSFVFVGYSLSDPNIRALYSRASDILSKINEKLKKTTYVVFPASDEVDRMVSQCTWQARNATYIPLDAKEFFSRLQGAVETHALKQMKEQLAKRLGTSKESIDQKIEEIMRVFPDFNSPERVLLYLYAITKGS
jgi:hypothetical protein